jgi:uroporphyrinogen decarboxylase
MRKALELKPILNVIGGKRLSTPPVWFMRQAGRYLPEYRALREKAGGFLELCYNPEWAAEVTLQPIRRFGFNAAILFSDILIVPHALGQRLWFETGEGPRLEPQLTHGWIDSLVDEPKHLSSICETVKLVRAALDADTKLSHTTLIGFAGSPWTVATYMIAGQGSKDHAAARLLSYRDPVAMEVLLEKIVQTTISYLLGQIAAGAETVMLFDSWSGVVTPSQREALIFNPTAKIVAGVRASVGADFPIIGFPRGGSAWAAEYVVATKVSAVAVEETANLMQLSVDLPTHIAVQGNLDPLLLLAGGALMVDEIRRIKQALSNRPHIFNLGHGIFPITPLAHVQLALDTIREA